MEEESKGWEMQEYFPSGADGKILRRIIRRGLRIGKTIIVTGVVISSAPFVLPPLMVVSAVGLACSVPFGLFMASYACAEKLMSKLLPMPKPPPSLPLLLEWKGFPQTDELSCIDWESDGDIYDNGMEEDEELLVVVANEADLDPMIPLQMSEDVQFEGGVDMEDEQRFLKDTKESVEMRISLTFGEEEETVPKDEYYKGKSLMEEQKVDEEYQEEAGRNSTQQEGQSTIISNNEIPGNESHPMVEILRQEKPADNVKFDDLNVAQKTHEGIQCTVVEVEGPYGLTIGAIEQIDAGEKPADQVERSITGDLEYSYVEKRSAHGKKRDDTAQRRAIAIDDVRGTGVEDREKMSGVLNSPAEQVKKTLEYEIAATQDERAEQNINVTPANLKLVGETQWPQLKNLEDQQLATHASSTTKRKKKTKKKKPKSGETIEGAALDTHPEVFEGAMLSNADARNSAGESRLNLAVERNKAGEEIHSNANTAGVVQPIISDETSRTQFGRSLKASPEKALFNEDKIWENIEALRKIVGYRVTRHQTCLEELNALYVFTGVEPPMSFKSSPDVGDPSALEEVNYKLRLLMAIVGVK